MIRRSILTYLLLSSVLLVWHPVHFLKDVLVAPLIFLVPLGLGLSMTRLCLGNLFEQAAPSKLSLLLLSLFLGLTGQTIAYQQLERYDLLQQLYPGLYPLALGGALVGFYREHTLLHTDSSDRTSFLGAAVLFPLMLLMYGFYYIKFAQYPLRDIFQETHFMKGAVELARFRILNPFTADSYIPLLQVHLGVLHDWYGYDLLSSQWILPVLCAIVRYASLHCFFSAVTDSKLTRIVAAGFAIITLQNLFSSTNGDMLLSVCLVLMAVLIRFERGWRSYGSTWLFLGALMMFSIVLYKVSTVQTIGNYWAVAAGGIAAVYSRRIPGASAITAQSILLCATGVALHPAVALLYLFCSLGTVGIHRTILSGWSQWSEARRRGFLVLLTVLTAFTGGFFAILLRQVFDREKSQPILHGVAEWILGKEITGAEGLRNTIIEWIRLAPPAFLFLFSLLAVFQGVAIWRRSRLEGEASLSEKTDTSWISPSLIFAWTGSLAGLALSFSGLPYVHRALYFPLILGCLLIAFFLHQEIVLSLEKRQGLVLLKYGIFLLGYLIVSGRYGYRMTELGAHSSVPYVQALSPYFGLTILGIIILLGTAALTRTPWRRTVLILSIIFLGVVSDKFAVKSYGYRYSYGDGWVKGRPISHYSLPEVELAARIHNLPLNTVLMSDPYTLSIVQAQTGLNGLYTFSNLGVMREEYRHSLRAILRSIRDSIASNQVAGNEALLRLVMEFILLYPGALPETRYVLENKMTRGLDMHEIKDDLVIILNVERTFQWMEGKESYFPFSEEESTPIRAEDIAKVFEVIQNVDDKVFALRLMK